MTQTETPENSNENLEIENQALEEESIEDTSNESGVGEVSQDEASIVIASEEMPEDSNLEAPSETLILSDNGEIVWNNVSIARLLPNQPLLSPKFELIGPELNQEETAKVVNERLDGWLVETIRTDLAPLFRLKRAIEFVAPIVPIVEIVTKSKGDKGEDQEEVMSPDAEEAAETLVATEPSIDEETSNSEAEQIANDGVELIAGDTEVSLVKSSAIEKKPKKPVRAAPKEFTPAAKEIAQLVFDNCGILDRSQFEAKITALSQDNRRELRSAGIKFGRNAIYLPLLLKPKPARLNVILSSLAKGTITDKPLLLPPLGVTSFEVLEGFEYSDYLLCGFQKLGARAIRLDIVDRVIDTLFDASKETKGGFVLPLAVVSLLGVSNEAAQNILSELGWTSEDGEDGVKKWRFKRPQPVYKRPENNKRNNERDKKPLGSNIGARTQKPHSQGFKKKHAEKGEKMRTPRDYSARPSRNIEDSPFAILASLKAELQNKKD